MSLLSVIVPTFNRAGLIRRCFDSVVAQEHRPLEFLVADDCSTDDTAAAVRQLPAAEGVKVSYLPQATNQGVSAARNLALRAAQGSLVALLDSDDVWFPTHLSKLRNKLEAQNADVAYSRGDIRESPEVPPSDRSSFGPTEHEEQHVAECLYYYNFVLPSASLLKQRCFAKIGLFDEDPQIQHAEDWDIYLRVSAAGLQFSHVRETTVYYTTPKYVPESKRLMMMRRFIYCQVKHSNYTGAPAFQRRFTRGYYQVWLGMMLGGVNPEAQNLFQKAYRLSWTTPSLALPSIWGLMLPRLSATALPFGRRALTRLYRGIRAKHRTMRGFPDPWD